MTFGIGVSDGLRVDFVIFRVCPDKPNVNDKEIVVDPNNEAKLIATDIEYNATIFQNACVTVMAFTSAGVVHDACFASAYHARRAWSARGFAVPYLVSVLLAITLMNYRLFPFLRQCRSSRKGNYSISYTGLGKLANLAR